MNTKPVNLTEALASFDDVDSPRIVARMNDHDVKIAHTRGEHVWHVHDETDEFFLVLDGEFVIAMRDVGGSETSVVLRTADIFVVPMGTEHKPSLPGGVDPHVRAIGNLNDGRPAYGRDPGSCRQHNRPRAGLSRLDGQVHPSDGARQGGQMIRHHVRPEGLPPTNGYSHAVAFGGLIAVSGQVPLDADGRLVGQNDAEAQVRQVFDNLRAALAAADAGLEHIVKLTIFLTDLEDLEVFRRVRDEYLVTDSPPASSLVQVSGLVNPAFRIEIEALAAA